MILSSSTNNDSYLVRDFSKIDLSNHNKSIKVIRKTNPVLVNVSGKKDFFSTQSIAEGRLQSKIDIKSDVFKSRYLQTNVKGVFVLRQNPLFSLQSQSNFTIVEIDMTDHKSKPIVCEGKEGDYIVQSSNGSKKIIDKDIFWCNYSDYNNGKIILDDSVIKLIADLEKTESEYMPNIF